MKQGEISTMSQPSHKGYTINYFINFFSGIPSSRWTTDAEVQTTANGSYVRCAVGHARFNRRTEKSDCKVRVKALKHFLGAQETADINDGAAGYSVLGKTPRARILAALRNRKRTGNVFGRKASS
jgi:hypothetical protein